MIVEALLERSPMMFAYRFTNVLGMKRATEKIVPKLQNFEQKYRRTDFVPEMLTTL